MNSSERPSIVQILKTKDGKSQRDTAVNGKADHYLKYFDSKKDREETKELRTAASMDVVNNYYDLATDFYEYGWGEAFHFAVLQKGESREHSFAKYEYSLALKLGLEPGDLVLDAGCGIGGPARHIASFSRAKVIGINCNDYQLQRARELTRLARLENLCSFVKGDYHHLTYADGSFDKAYAIEATCHSPNIAAVYAEICRVLKPGGLFACCEWVMTDKYDSNNSYHRKLKDDILEGDGLSDIVSIPQVHAAIKESGFEIVEARDHAVDSTVPWYTVLMPQWTISDIKITPMGRWMTHIMLMVLETIRLAPSGSVKVHRMLCKGADSLAAAGLEGIFSPMYILILRKPDNKN